MNVIAVDVGTTSVRLAIISFCGDNAKEANILASHKRDIGHHQRGERFEQSSDEIWRAICECCQECIKGTNINPDSIESIAFSATCSLVIEHGAKQNPGDNVAKDVIMWMDHRAIEQAQRITSSNSKVLAQFGGVCSPEFSLSKLIWLKDNDSELFNSASGFFELPDWLVYKCIGGQPRTCPRSLCCVTCKWGFDSVENHHCDIINSIETPKLADKIGNSILGPGTVAGYLCELSASQLGLKQQPNHHEHEINSQNKENEKPMKKIVVGTSLIDAHSGMLAMLSVPFAGKLSITHQIDIESTLCSLAGTSSCHMLLSGGRNFTRGIWGPYRDVVLEGYYLLEAGQSLTGRLIEICIESHGEGKRRLQGGEKMYEIIGNLNEQVKSATNNKCFGADLHMLPTFHGNRSPLANPRLRGGVYGLSVSGEKSLIEYYVATIEALIYETKLIVESLGTKLQTILVSGGLMKNEFYMQTLAEVLRCRVVRMDLGGVDFMVMGSGLVARHAALSQANRSPGTIEEHCNSEPLTRKSIEDIQYQQLETKIFEPRENRSAYHEKKYLCYKEFVELSQRIDRIMNH